MNDQAEAAERASAYVVARVRAKRGATWRQGARTPALPIPIPTLTQGAGELSALHRIATTRLKGVEEAVARALVAWARGEREVELRVDVPPAAHVLALQARGARCVSLLEDDGDAAPHEDGLAFALHDLCHLEKFHDPEHHEAQVGFFAMVHDAYAGGRLAWMDAAYDAGFRDDFAHVVADMNGSPIFLVAALKMKLKMASRRALAHARGTPAPAGGPLDPAEQRAFDQALDALLGALQWPAAVRDAARLVTTKRDAPQAALCLREYLAARGRERRTARQPAAR